MDINYSLCPQAGRFGESVRSAGVVYTLLHIKTRTTALIVFCNGHKDNHNVPIQITSHYTITITLCCACL